MGVNKAGAQDVYSRWVKPIERGNRVVVIDPRCSEEASKAYLWIQIKGGTDGALGRAGAASRAAPGVCPRCGDEDA